jgi:ATP-dependent DNA helicase RecG
MASMDAHSRRQAALDAIAAVAGGAKAGDVETEIVDFKEEAHTVGRSGKRAAIDAHHEPAANALAAEVACMAMSDEGGVIVVGVDDKESGPGAFVGSFLDLQWLRTRIHALTQPNFSIDVPEEVMQGGKRLYLINVPPALSEIRSGGKLRTRQGTDCVELHGDRAREFLERRRSYDWSAEGSSAKTCARTSPSPSFWAGRPCGSRPLRAPRSAARARPLRSLSASLQQEPSSACSTGAAPSA